MMKKEDNEIVIKTLDDDDPTLAEEYGPYCEQFSTVVLKAFRRIGITKASLDNWSSPLLIIDNSLAEAGAMEQGIDSE